jgi:hypothetical protein
MASNFQKEIRKLISPIITELNMSRMGMFHTALIIGPWYIEWNDSALCIPRKCTSKSAFLTADIGVMESKETVETIADKLANVIVDWNSRVSYTTIGAGKNQGNCQMFVESVLNSIDMKFNTSGSLGKFLEIIKKKGNTKLVLPLSDEVKKKLEITDDVIEFKTHTDLDQFLKNVLKKDLHFENRDEAILLKAFDRAFWLKYLKCSKDLKENKKLLRLIEINKHFSQEEKEFRMKHLKEKIEKDEEIYKECVPLNEEDCPFGNPKNSNSIL